MPVPELPARVLDGRGPAVLFVHGLLTSPETWAANVGPLSAVCRPVLVTLWGHAGAPVPDDPAAFRPDGYVAQFEALRQRLGVERWVVVGQSLGGALALHYGLAHPERIAGVAVTNAMSLLSGSWSHDRVLPMLEERAVQYERDGRAAFDTDPLHPRRSRRATVEERARHLAAWEQHRPEGMVGTYRHTVARLSLHDHLPSVTPPVLLLHGVREEGFAPVAAAVRAAVPDVEVVELDAGHLVNQHDPDGFNAAVAAFVRRVAPES